MVEPPDSSILNGLENPRHSSSTGAALTAVLIWGFLTCVLEKAGCGIGHLGGKVVLKLWL